MRHSAPIKPEKFRPGDFSIAKSKCDFDFARSSIGDRSVAIYRKTRKGSHPDIGNE